MRDLEPIQNNLRRRAPANSTPQRHFGFEVELNSDTTTGIGRCANCNVVRVRPSPVIDVTRRVLQGTAALTETRCWTTSEPRAVRECFPGAPSDMSRLKSSSRANSERVCSFRVGLKAVLNRNPKCSVDTPGQRISGSQRLLRNTRANGLAKKIKHSHPRSPCSLRIVAEPPEFGALRQAPHIEAMSCVGIEDGVEPIGRRPLQRLIA